MAQWVTFNYQEWAARYPEFDTTVLGPAAQDLFAQAEMLHANDRSGPVASEDQQKFLLYLLVAHLAQIYYGSTTTPISPFVGPITNASEGSVSVGAQIPQLPGSAAWYALSKYGYNYWFATAPFRTMRYRAVQPRQFNPPFAVPLIRRVN